MNDYADQPEPEPRRKTKYDTPFGRVVEAAIDLADCDSEDDRSFRLARFKLRHAVELWKASGYPD